MDWSEKINPLREEYKEYEESHLSPLFFVHSGKNEMFLRHFEA